MYWVTPADREPFHSNHVGESGLAGKHPIVRAATSMNLVQGRMREPFAITV